MKRDVVELILLAAATLAVQVQPAPAQPTGPGSALKQSGKGPLKVFILAGQSNMEGYGAIAGLEEGVDIKAMVLPPGKKPWHKSNDGTPTVGWFFVGEWMHYGVEVTPGVYDLHVRYTTPIMDKKIEVYLDSVLISIHEAACND